MDGISNIGRSLVAMRKTLGMTQRQLGERLGVSQPQVARWERDAYRTASLEKAGAVAAALGFDPAKAPFPLAAEASAGYAVVDKASATTGERALARLGVRPESIAAFCRVHGVAEMALFGSAVRTDFRPDSDVDVLVAWSAHRTSPSLSELDDLEEELRGIFRRKVDLVERCAVERSENQVRRSHILNGARSIYVS